MESSQDPARIPTPPPNPTSDDELTFSDLQFQSANNSFIRLSEDSELVSVLPLQSVLSS